MALIKQTFRLIFSESFAINSYQKLRRLRLQTIDKLLFSEYILLDSEFLLKNDAYPFRLITVEMQHLDARLQRQFTDNEQWTQDEYLIYFNKPCVIEPNWGWGIYGFNKLIYPSLGFSRAEYLPKPALFRSKPMRYFKELISLRDTGERNYFHFYNDIIPKLLLLKQYGIFDRNTPVLVAESLYVSSAFQYFFKRSFLSEINWVVQGSECVHAEKTYFCKPLTHTKNNFDWFLNHAPDFTIPQKNEKIFITRGSHRVRHLENKGDAENIARSYGFKIVDFDELDIEAQMNAFASARYAIGIHGAGLTNMIYRRGKELSLLEIYPPSDYYPFHYVLLATLYGYKYDAMVGIKSKTKFSKSFRIDLDKMRSKIEQMLQY